MSEVILQPHHRGLILSINDTSYVGSSEEIYQTLLEKWSGATEKPKTTHNILLPSNRGRELLRKAEKLTGQTTTPQEDDNEQSAIVIQAINKNFTVTTIHEGNEVVSRILSPQTTQDLVQQLLPYLEY